MKRERVAGTRAARDKRSAFRQCLIVTGLIVLVSLWLKVPSLFVEHTETDERIYWQLAQSLAAGRGYTLRGSVLLESLSPHIYDRSLFHHPPLFAALLVPFALADAKPAAIIVSWLGHVLSVLAVALIGWRTLIRGSQGNSALSPGFWLPLLALSADPLLGFIASRLWIDSLLAGLVAMSFAMLMLASGERTRSWLVAAGALLALAGLTKLTALLVVPVFVVTIVDGERSWRSRLVSLASFVAPVCLLVVPWLVLFRAKCGVFVPGWVAPDAWLVDHSDFVKAALDRPWYYYAVKLPLVLPMAAVAGWALCGRQGIRTNRTMRIATAWGALVVGALTTISAMGYGFQMRHVAPAVAPIYIIVMTGLLEAEHPIALFVCGCALAIGTFTAGLHVLAQVDEVFGLAEIARLVGF